MKNLILPALMVVAFSAPTFAQTNTGVEADPYPGLEGLNCIELVEKLDVTLQEVEISDELRVQILELREKGLNEKSADDEDACVTSLTAAFQLLVPAKE